MRIAESLRCLRKGDNWPLRCLEAAFVAMVIDCQRKHWPIKSSYRSKCRELESEIDKSQSCKQAHSHTMTCKYRGEVTHAHTHTHTHTHARPFLWPGNGTWCRGCSREIMRYMGGTDPIRALGFQAKVRQVTNTYAMPRGTQTELHSPHSISEQGLKMHVFHGNNVEMGKQWNWGDYALSPVSSKFYSHWTHAGLSRHATFKWQPCFWVPKSISNSTPQGERLLISVKWNIQRKHCILYS